MRHIRRLEEQRHATEQQRGHDQRGARRAQAAGAHDMDRNLAPVQVPNVNSLAYPAHARAACTLLGG
eukprot:4588977-Prymnesium_polylepis.1